MTAAASIIVTPEHLNLLCPESPDWPTHAWLTISGSGMEPALTAGSRVRLRPEPGRFEIGRIMVYRRNGVLAVRRLVAMVDNAETGRLGLIFRGDAERGAAPAVAVGDVIGAVVAVRKPSVLWRLRRNLGLLLAERRAARAAVRPPHPLEGAAQ